MQLLVPISFREQTPHHKMGASSAAAVRSSSVACRLVAAAMLMLGAVLFAS